MNKSKQKYYGTLKIVMIPINDKQMNKISTLNNSYGIHLPLNKLNQNIIIKHSQMNQIPALNNP